MVSSAKTSGFKTALPRVLVVDDEPGLREIIEDVLRKGIDCRVVLAANIAEAREIILTQPVQLMVADVNLPDGDGTSLLSILQRNHPSASAIVITGNPSIATAIHAIRQGALDFIPKPFTHQQLTDRLRSALEHQARFDKHEKRYVRLKTAVKKLNASRRTISRKVDLLCNDLVSAYGDLSRQLDQVRTQEAFRKTIDGAADLEQLLCHAMDWMLRQVGYCNVATFLAGEDGDFQLGAYMKYTIAGDAIVTDALKRVLLAPTTRDGVLHANSKTFQKQFAAEEYHLMKGNDILGVNCTYLGESLATLLFFRDAKTPFSAEDEAILRSVSAIFAIELASVVREPRPESEEGDAPPAAGHDDAPAPRKDPADWWKSGGESPF